jgi:hypothetical protein
VGVHAELEPVEKWSTGPVRPVGITCPTGEIPAKPIKNRRKNDENFLEKQFL